MADAPSAAEFSRCPDCGKQLIFVRTIWRAFEPTIDVWACEPCQKIVRRTSTETRP